MSLSEAVERVATGWQRAVAALGTAASYGYAVVFVLTLYEVFARYVLRQPTAWTMEVCLLLAGIHYLVSGVTSHDTGQHIRVDALTSLLPPPVRRALELAQLVIVAGVCGTLSWWALQQARVAIAGFERSGTPLNWPLPVILKSVVAAVLIAIACSALLKLLSPRAHHDDDVA